MSEVWTVRRVLQWTQQHFEKKAVDAPRLTAEVLLSFASGVDRVRLYMDLDRPLDPKELSRFRGLVERRASGEPTQYLTGQREFYNRTFAVDPRVLIPRPETELLVEAVLKAMPRDRVIRVVNLCTGSGCIAVTLAAERPLAEVWATDLSLDACAVAKKNAGTHQVAARCRIESGDLFGGLPLDTRFGIVVSNPPYVAQAELGGLQAEVQREPRLALDGGPDGLAVIRRVIDESQDRLEPDGLLAMEIGETQGAAVRALLLEAGYTDVRIEQDLEKRERMAFGARP